MELLFSKIIPFVISLVTLLCSLFGLPYYPIGEDTISARLESDFVLTLNEDFSEDTVNKSLWSGHYTYGTQSSQRRAGYWNNELPFIREGNLVIPCLYLDEGIGGTGAGWYTAGLDTDGDNGGGFSQLYGYFECRCILPKGAQIWSAFWLMNDGVYNEDGSGKDGTEIDVYESFGYSEAIFKNRVSSNLHFDGYGDAHQSYGGQEFFVKGNPYEEYNTYGLEWNEKEYIFYINGVETFRTSFGGVSQNPEYLILSVEVADTINDSVDVIEGDCAEFVVDYVRAYQYKDLIK